MNSKWKLNLRLFAIAGTLIILLNLIIFLSPIPWTQSVWAADGFIVLAVVAQLVVFFIAYGKGNSARSRFYGWPITRVGLMYLLATALADVVFILLELATDIPLWLVFVVNFLLIGITIPGVIITESSRDFVEKQRERRELRMDTMKYLRRLSRELVMRCSDPELKKRLTDLANAFDYSDPNSSPGLVNVEQELEEELNKLGSLVNGDAAAARQQADHVEEVLKIRNEMCIRQK